MLSLFFYKIYYNRFIKHINEYLKYTVLYDDLLLQVAKNVSLYLCGTETCGKDKELFSMMCEYDILPLFKSMKKYHIDESLQSGIALNDINTHAVLTCDVVISTITSLVVIGVPTAMGLEFIDNNIRINKFAQQSSMSSNLLIFPMLFQI